MTPDESAALNICFLRDTAANLSAVAATGAAAGIACYTPIGEEELFRGLLPQGFSLIPQRGDGFGERLLCAAQDLLACGFGAVCLIDSDSPTVPAAAYTQAVSALAEPGDRVVLGGSNDGGYYLIGLKQPHPAPFANIGWSSAAVFDQTVAACECAGLALAQLPLWYDVDDGATLALLAAELLDESPPPFALQPGCAAPFSRGFLAGQRRAATR